MPLVNIVLADAQATPVNHTFIPTGPDKNGVQYLTDYSQSNALGYWQISIQTTRPAPVKSGDSAAGRTYKVKIGLHEPVLAQYAGGSQTGFIPAARVEYVSRSFCEFIMPEQGADLDRKNLRKMTANLLANPSVLAIIENLEQV